MSDYHCAECGFAVVILKDGTRLRPCGHTGTIIAGMSATATGIAKVENAATGIAKVENAFQKH